MPTDLTRTQINNPMRLFFLLTLVVSYTSTNLLADQRGAAEPKTAAAVYGQGVRETPKLSPQQEAAGFTCPMALWLNS